MSGHTEFQRVINRYKIFRGKLLSLARHYLLPWFRLRVIEGVLIGAHHGPLPGAKVTLNSWRSVKTDENGRFQFYFVFRKVNHLTVQWHEAELNNWITIDLSRKRVSRLKLKWPPLVRGELINVHGEPMTNVPVALNHHILAQTDAHGTFIFPLEQEPAEHSDHLVFQLNGHTYVHHFKANPKAFLLHRFMYQEGLGVFHIEDRPFAQACTKSIQHFNHQFRWGLRLSILVILLYILVNIWFTQQQKKVFLNLVGSTLLTEPLSHQSQSSPQASLNTAKKWSDAGILERKKEDDHSNMIQQKVDAQPSLSIFDSLNQSKSQIPLNKQTSEKSHISELDELEAVTCQSMEFVYKNYYVPRGMEGILLSLVFGNWQTWRDDLSIFNGMNRHEQLQAGQRIKLMLPLHTWTMYRHQDDDSFRALLDKAQCGEAEFICKQLIQAWNPHVRLQYLRKHEQLLIHFDLLTRRPFKGATLSRIEGLRRGTVPKRKAPRVELPQHCKIFSSLPSEGVIE